MEHRNVFATTVISVCAFIFVSQAKLAREESAGGGTGSDFSYDSRYAHRNDGTVNALTGRASYHMNLREPGTEV
jgi:hypothetical protein